MYELSPQNLALPAGHLQLGVRALNGCAKLSANSIQEVRWQVASGVISPESMGKKTCEEIKRACKVLEELTDCEGHVDWPSYWDRVGVSKVGTYMTSTSLRRLSAEVCDLPLGRLNLGKACSGLEAVGIRTIGGLVDAAQSGIGELKNFGKVSRDETVAALRALSDTTEEDGSIDWTNYARARGFVIVPSSGLGDIGSDFFRSVFPEACKKVILSQFDDRAWLIFDKRLLVSKEESETLQAIGDVFEITRERVRQIEDECLSALRRPLLQDDYRGLGFLFHPDLAGLFRAARDHFQAMALPAWTRTHWLSELSETWRIPPERLAERYRLIAEILGYRAVNLEDRELEPLVVEQSSPRREVHRLAASVRAIHQVLSDGAVRDAFGIAKALKGASSLALRIDEVPALIALCSSAEVVDEGLYQLSFEHLQGRGNQAVRVLSERGEAMSNRDLVREINRRLPSGRRLEGHQNLVNQMTADPRLKPIGKSGQWVLTEWGVETRSLVDLLEEALTRAGEAMHLDDLRDQVLAVRPGSESSILMLLESNSGRFRKLGRHVYGLASWGDSVTSLKSMGALDVAAFVRDFFQSRGVEEVELGELTEALCSTTGLKPRSARGILKNSAAVAVRSPDARTRIARFDPDWQLKPRKKFKRAKPLQSDLIIDAAVAKLVAADTGERPLVELVREIESELGVGRPNIYAAIDQTDAIEKIPVDGSVFKICRVAGRSSHHFPQLSELSNPVWRAECERGLRKLNVDDVDVALFQLGRQFDQSMHQLLEYARDREGRDVNDGNLRTLQTCIDWALKHQYFNDKATLNLLRVERNERGHQPPTLEEREAIMKFAPFLAGLYIDYLILIDRKMPP